MTDRIRIEIAPPIWWPTANREQRIAELLKRIEAVSPPGTEVRPCADEDTKSPREMLLFAWNRRAVDGVRAGGESTVVLRDPETVEATLIDVCQLLDGWHQDGTVWSTWDETVRQRAGKLLREVYDQNKARGIRSTAYSPPALPSEPSEPK